MDRRGQQTATHKTGACAADAIAMGSDHDQSKRAMKRALASGAADPSGDDTTGRERGLCLWSAVVSNHATSDVGDMRAPERAVSYGVSGHSTPVRHPAPPQCMHHRLPARWR